MNAAQQIPQLTLALGTVPNIVARPIGVRARLFALAGPGATALHCCVMNLRDLDLNLLRTLEVLIEERQVSRSALRLGVGQPAVSHALGRLRRHFGDALLVRQGQEMVLTPRAEELAGPLRQVLAAVRRLTGPAHFDPARAEGQLRIACTDFALAIVMPHVLGGLARQAPGLG